jgi:non-heme chloroperoxidase
MKQVIVLMLLLQLFQPAKLFAQLPPQLAGLQIPTESKPDVKTITLKSGIRLEYAEQGDIFAPAVIFLHGLSDSRHSFAALFESLPDNIHAIAITQRGHGNSDKPAEGYRLADFVKDIADFMQARQMQTAFIAGHSMGGMVAQQIAVSYPSMVQGLVIIASDANFMDNPGSPEFYNTILKMQGPIERSFMDEFQRSTLHNSIDPEYLNTLVDESMKLTLPVFKAVCTGIFNSDLSKAIAAIKAPTLILGGDKDLICAPGEQQKMQSAIPRSKLIMYENTGHALHWENPHRVVNDLVHFIEKNTRVAK